MNPTPDTPTPAAPAPSGPWPKMRWHQRLQRAERELRERFELSPDAALTVTSLIYDNRVVAGWPKDRRERVRAELASHGIAPLMRDAVVAVAEFGSVEAYIAWVRSLRDEMVRREAAEVMNDG